MFALPELRVALGLGDQELEQRLRPALDAADDLAIVVHCLAADQLLSAVESRQVDAVVVGWSLHRLTETVIAQLERAPVKVVLLVADPAEPRWTDRQAAVLPVSASADDIRAVLDRAGRTSAASRIRIPVQTEPVPLKPEDAAATPTGVLAIWSGAGSPGRSTIALNLAYALGSVAPTVLVDLDLSASALTAYLDRDPSRNICTLAHAVRTEATTWSAALDRELQPLSEPANHARVLCGPPKPEMRGSLSPAFVERLVPELARRFRYVILDVGAEVLGGDAAPNNHRAALASAAEILLVSGADLASLWHARAALDHLEQQLDVTRVRVPLVLSACDDRFHHGRSEIEWHLGAPVVATIPYDHAAAAQAAAAQRPLLQVSRGRSGRALLELAERVHAGRLRLGPELASATSARRWWQRLVPRSADPERAPAPVRTDESAELVSTAQGPRQPERAS